jgi:hypothetical protein
VVRLLPNAYLFIVHEHIPISLDAVRPTELKHDGKNQQIQGNRKLHFHADLCALGMYSDLT